MYPPCRLLQASTFVALRALLVQMALQALMDKMVLKDPLGKVCLQVVRLVKFLPNQVTLTMLLNGLTLLHLLFRWLQLLSWGL